MPLQPKQTKDDGTTRGLDGEEAEISGLTPGPSVYNGDSHSGVVGEQTGIVRLSKRKVNEITCYPESILALASTTRFSKRREIGSVQVRTGSLTGPAERHGWYLGQV